MPLWKAVGSTVALTFVNLNVATCRSPAEGGGAEPSPKNEAKAVVVLDGIDTTSLTPREQKEWSTYVSELLAPCPDQPVSLAQCVKESRPCATCLPAAKFLVNRVTRGGTRSQVEQAFRLRFAPDQVNTIDEGSSPWKGAKDAPVTVVEWADFECPYCGAAAPIIDDLVDQYPGLVRIVFKNYPLASHENSELTARASVAAGRQGKFWEMHEAMFASQEAGLTRENVLALAKRLGLEARKFTADLDSEEVADAVAVDRKQAEKLGLKGTPMIYVNGRHFELEQFSLLDDLNPWIELEIEQRTGKKVTAKAIAPPRGAESGAPASSAPPGAPPASAAPPSKAP